MDRIVIRVQAKNAEFDRPGCEPGFLFYYNVLQRYSHISYALFKLLNHDKR